LKLIVSIYATILKDQANNELYQLFIFPEQSNIKIDTKNYFNYLFLNFQLFLFLTYKLLSEAWEQGEGCI